MPRTSKAEIEKQRVRDERYAFIDRKVNTALRDNVIYHPERYDCERHSPEIDEAADALMRTERDYAAGLAEETAVKERYSAYVQLHLREQPQPNA